MEIAHTNWASIGNGEWMESSIIMWCTRKKRSTANGYVQSLCVCFVTVYLMAVSFIRKEVPKLSIGCGGIAVSLPATGIPQTRAPFLPECDLLNGRIGICIRTYSKPLAKCYTICKVRVSNEYVTDPDRVNTWFSCEIAVLLPRLFRTG